MCFLSLPSPNLLHLTIAIALTIGDAGMPTRSTRLSGRAVAGVGVPALPAHGLGGLGGIGGLSAHTTRASARQAQAAAQQQAAALAAAAGGGGHVDRRLQPLMPQQQRGGSSSTSRSHREPAPAPTVLRAAMNGASSTCALHS